MTQNEFLTALSYTTNYYDWDYVDNKLTTVVPTGKLKNTVLNPVTAVAYYFGFGFYPATKRGTERAARALGLTQQLAHAVYSQSNRGHAQIVRGKMLSYVF